MRYDFQDLAPTSLVQAQQAHKAVTCPVWAGFEGSTALHGFGTPSPGSVVIDIDVNQIGFSTGLSWYRVITGATFTPMSSTDRNLYGGCLLDLCTANGVATAGVGTVFINYEVEVCEPIASAQQA
jgi:hypothetical protein